MDSLSHRKGKVNIFLVDKNGNSVNNIDATYRFTNHKFLFGSNAFDVLAYTSIEDEKVKAFFYERVKNYIDLYNYATLPFYWGDFEPTEGNPKTDNLMKASLFLQERNIKIKGHPLCWHTVCAPWLLEYDDATILQKQLNRIEREVNTFKGVIDRWDVINEVVIMPYFDKYDNAVTRICKANGQVELVKKVFDEARKNNPNATLVLNDFNTSPAYEELIERCLDKGVDISVIGIQSHQHQGYWGKDKIYDVLERFSRFNLPIHFTENTILSGSPVPDYIEDLNDWQVEEWPSTPEYEEIQRVQMEEMFRILFSCPQVEAITGWDFCDGQWLNAPSGICRKDNSVKPAYLMLRDLIKKEWATNGSTTSDDRGLISFEGFKGEYELIIGNTSYKINLEEDTQDITLVVE